MTRRVSIGLLCLLLVAQLAAPGALAGSPTPVKYGKWNQDQFVPFTWKSELKPPAWIRPAVLAAAEDAGSTTGSRAGRFGYAESASSWISYEDYVCTDTALACAWNNAPTSFAIRIRPQGWSFDWGSLRWCQNYEAWPSGCFDAEMIILHEFGHIQSLGHVEEPADPADWLDSVMHGTSRAKNKTGWNEHEFGRCDVAALQATYQPASAATPISTCLALRTALSVTAPGGVAYRGFARFTASLATADDVAYAKLRGLPLSQRAVMLERRPLGGSWSAYAQLSPTSIDGQYSISIGLVTTADWRVTFAAPGDEGLLGSASPTVRVTVAECTSYCPQGGGGV